MVENSPHGVGHEERDVNPLAVGKFAIALVLVCLLSLALLLGLFRYFLSAEGGKADETVRLPAEPRLEVTPAQDLKAIRAAEDQALNSYGWIDQQKGVVRVPINRAIDLLVQKGLPSRSQSEAQAAASDVSMPTDSGLGVKMPPEEAK